MLSAVALFIACIGLAALVQGGWIYLKAYLASQLINDAWESAIIDHAPRKPWPWADTWPVARLQVAAIGLDQKVLQGQTGQALAFAPGQILVSGATSDSELHVISGHRDTHFRQLGDIRVGDQLQWSSLDGKHRLYRVIELAVVASEGHYWQAPVDGRYLALVTCYPLDGIQAESPERLVVIAKQLAPG